jgi:purine-binding chemotaxis protein CheW
MVMKSKEPMSAEQQPACAGNRPDAGQAPPEDEWMPTREEGKKILKARARELARKPEGEETGIERIEIVEFLLAYERYGMESSYIGEVYPLKDLTPLPCTPPFVLGIMNVRGNIISVIDLRKFFDLPEKGLTDLNKVIIVHGDTIEFGILADAVLGSRRIPVTDLQLSLPTITDVRADYLKGVTEDRLVVLDGGKILADQRIVVHEDV